MFWQEDQNKDEFQVPDHIQDLHFDIDCRELPVDHIYALSRAVFEALPWLEQIPQLGIHEIYLAGSQNGWQKPDPELGQTLILSRRTKLVIRTPQEIMERLQEEISSLTLDIDGYSMTVGKARSKPLSMSDTIYARHIAMETGEAENENQFLQRMAEELSNLGVAPKKALCGKSTEIRTGTGVVQTRSLMLADLKFEESINLQIHGLGSHRSMGCGLFLPMKGIQALKLDN